MLALKLFLVPSLLWAITLIGRRWGQTVAGWLTGFPLMAAPVLLLIALEQGLSFAITAAAAAQMAVLGNVFFCLTYAWLATRWPRWLCVFAGMTVFSTVAGVLMALALPSVWIFSATLAALLISWHLFPRHVALRMATATAPSRLELPARMLVGASVVVIVTYSAERLGPALSGLFSSFPLLACVLAAFTHPASGVGAVIQLLRGLVSGFYALATFCFVLSVASESSGVAASFLSALGWAMVAQIGSLWIRKLSTRRAGFQ